MKPTNKGTVHFGTSGLVLPLPKRSFPPEFQDKPRLTYYATLFNSIEINSSFYKVPMAATVKRWADSVPEGFKFTFKLWREITHNKGLAYNPDDVYHFMQVISNVGHKKGTLLVQFPPSFNVSGIRQLEQLLSHIQHADAARSWKIALEFRNRTWYAEDVYDLISQYYAGIVVQDMPTSATPFRDESVDFKYVRFHGPNGAYRGSYTSDFLYEYAQYIKEWQQEGKELYIYFNNTMGAALENLQTLTGFLQSEIEDKGWNFLNLW